MSAARIGRPLPLRQPASLQPACPARPLALTTLSQLTCWTRLICAQTPAASSCNFSSGRITRETVSSFYVHRCSTVAATPKQREPAGRPPCWGATRCNAAARRDSLRIGEPSSSTTAASLSSSLPPSHPTASPSPAPLCATHCAVGRMWSSGESEGGSQVTPLARSQGGGGTQRCSCTACPRQFAAMASTTDGREPLQALQGGQPPEPAERGCW